MQRSGFFNALLKEGVYDRKYNANDYSDNLAVVISNGVLRSENDDLKVTADGLTVTVGVGRAWINGHYYYNDTPHTFAAVSAPAGGTRYDRVILRLDTDISARTIELVYREGTAANTPTKPEIVRNDTVFELVLADIFIDTNATSVTVTDTRADDTVCGWVYSVKGDGSFFVTLDNDFYAWFKQTRDTVASVTLFKRYNWRTVVDTAASVFSFNIPQYDEEVCFIEVYVNGILETEGIDYTLNGNTITFEGTLISGTEIEVKAFKSIDGTGIMSVADEITELQNAVAAINAAGEYEYICNGTNDNVVLSNLVRTLYSTDDYSSIKLNVIGNIGIAAAFGGSGTATSPYAWFNFVTPFGTNRIITVDFSRAGAINPPIESGTNNVVFRASKINIIGANVIASETGANTVVKISNTTSGHIKYEDCRFWITAYQDSIIAPHGNFINCRCSVANVVGDSCCFLPSTNGLLRLNGGEYYAYAGASTAKSAVIIQSAADAVSILYGANAPTVDREGFYQTNSVIQLVGGGMMNCTDLVSALPLSVTSGISNIRGTIAKSKANSM